MSIDGYVGSASDKRLILSNEADFDRVDAVRAASDAIVVGAATVRMDNPRLVVRSTSRRADRTTRGEMPSPTKVTMTGHVMLDPQASFFTVGDADKLVYVPTHAAQEAQERLGAVATIVDAGTSVTMTRLSDDLYDRGVRRMMVEGGAEVHTQFLTGNLVDELHLGVAPFFVGDSRARRFVGDGRFPWNAERRAELSEVRQIGDLVLLRYALSPRFDAGAFGTESAPRIVQLPDHPIHTHY